MSSRSIGSLAVSNPKTISPEDPESNGLRNITISTSQPSGGNDGDVWFVYT
jgi:hypothetical protein